MYDEETLRRWVALEGHKLNEGIVRKPRPLSELLREQAPVAPTKAGVPYEFDKEALERFADGLSPLVRAELKLPITFYVSHEDRTNCYVTDERALRAMEQLGLSHTEPRDGKLWMSLPLAYDIAKRYPTVFQFVRH